MDEVSKKEGRTVLFVSHNMNAIEQLCNRVVLLEKGKLIKDSYDVGSVVREYVYGNGGDSLANEWVNTRGEHKNNYFIPSRLVLVDNSGKKIGMPVRNDSDLWIQIEGEIMKPDSSLILGYAIFNEDGYLLYSTFQSDMPDDSRPKLEAGKCIFRSKLPRRILNEGAYRIELAIGLHNADWINQPGTNSPGVYLSIQGGLSDSSLFIDKRAGIIAPVLDWLYFKSQAV